MDRKGRGLGMGRIQGERKEEAEVPGRRRGRRRARENGVWVREEGGGSGPAMLRGALSFLLLPPCFLPRSGRIIPGSHAMFYAVRKGRKTGVYRTWEECREQVDRYKYASFKKFSSKEEAWAFINDGSAESSKYSAGSSDDFVERQESYSYRGNESTTWSDYRSFKRPNEETSETQHGRKRVKYTEVPHSSSQDKGKFSYMGDYAVVYTDGCCASNGRHQARAGMGVYWGPGHPLNTSERLPGRQTNQRAEILAACKAIEQAKSQNIKKLAIYTDSRFTINGATSWIPNWKANGWRTSDGKDVINKEDFERLATLSEGMEIQWMHVPGHAGFTGNEAADRLAKEGARKSH